MQAGRESKKVVFSERQGSEESRKTIYRTSASVETSGAKIAVTSFKGTLWSPASLSRDSGKLKTY